MNFDIALIIGFLVINLIVGIVSGRGVKTIKEYAIGNKKINTTIISASIIATWISGSFFTVSISQTYKDGVWFIPAAIGDILSLLIISYILAPKMKEFLNHISVAESMGKLYGKRIRLATAVASLAQATAMTALQIQVFSSLFSYFLEFSSLEATLISSFVVIFYSAWGGIKAVTFTDVLQFCTFGIFIPMFALFIWQTIGNSGAIAVAFHTNPLLDFKQLFNYKDARFLPNFSMMLWFLIPSLSSPTFQRTLMAKNINQIHKSFSVAAFGYTFIMIFICVIGLLILAADPTLDSNNLVAHILNNYSFVGLRGITLVGIMAMVMSTADSWINVGSVIFTHDICKPLGLKDENELLVSRIFAVFVGITAVLLVLSSSSLFKLFSLQANFYMPIVTMPLMLAILGFRTTPKAIGIGMVAGCVSVILWKLYLTPLTGIDSVVPSMFTNLFAFVSTHYILKQKGGWIVNISKNTVVKKQKHFDKFRFSQIVKYFQRYEPKEEVIYSYFAFAVLLTIIVTFSLNKVVYERNLLLVNSMQGIALFVSTLFFTRDLIWPTEFKNRYSGIIWCISIFICLSFISSMMVFLSNFSEISLVIFIVHLSIIGILLNWRMAFILILTGLLLSYFIYNLCVDITISDGLQGLKFKVIYIFFIISTFLITFLKPQQEYLEATEKKVIYLEKEADFARRELENVVQGLEFLEDQFKDKEGKLKAKKIYLKDQLKLRNIEIAKLKDLKDEFIRNIPHEANTPLTGILSLSDVLYSCYDSLDRKTLKQSIKDIVNSSDRLKTYINNIADLSKLSALTYDLKKEEVDLSEIVRERPVLYKKIFTDDAKQEFVFKVEDKLTVQCDEYYITQAIDNLISNAVKYGEGKPITISLEKTVNNKVKFTIMDQGIGIPKDELISIFHKFTTSSKTRTPAGGRGVGLALCEKVITVHEGTIEAQSNGEKGAEFSFVLPL